MFLRDQPKDAAKPASTPCAGRSVLGSCLTSLGHVNCSTVTLVPTILRGKPGLRTTAHSQHEGHHAQKGQESRTQKVWQQYKVSLH